MYSKALILFVGLFVVGSFAHSYVTKPLSRTDQTSSTTGCRMGDGGNCPGPCDGTKDKITQSPNAIARGDNITVYWPRNNHPGGFVRFAWALTADSDSASTFDSGAFIYTCFEIGATCKPDDPNTNGGNGGDSAGQFSCWYTFNAPGWLTDGLWTLQWAWFGGGFALGDYYSCVDYTVSGGPTATQAPAVFYGGDFADPGTNVCKFWNTDRLHQCVTEPCNNVTFPAQSAGAVYMVEVGTQATTGAPPQTTGAPSQTTGNAATPVTSSSTPLTSSSQNPASTGADGNGINNGNVTNSATPCKVDSDCSSNVCSIDGYCYVKSGGGLDAGGIAAIVFACLIVLIAAAIIVFFVINKKEVPYMVPFNLFV